jgi:putative transposase
MAWGSTVEEEKLRFIAEYLKGDLPMTALCASFGVSRETGYQLVRRYLAEGAAGLQPRSRAPYRPAQQTSEEIAGAVIALRRERPFWGPKKLRVLLQRRDPAVRWPAASTIGDLLRREGLSEPRRRRRTAVPSTRPFAPVVAPNDLWCIDFKGWFRTRDGQRCDPLTLSDAESRYLLACEAMPPIGAAVGAAVERAMREHGMPLAIRSDNGAPFASSGAGGLSRLAVQWVKLGIRLERIAPGAPQQNGRHERMHGTLKKETACPPAGSIAEQQTRFDEFRCRYNHERPHEALGQATPASRYQPSLRPYPERIEEPWYDADHALRRVRPTGEIKWGGEFVFVSEALAGEPVGIAETERGDWLVRFADVELGIIDRKTGKLRRFAPARPGRRKAHAEQTRETVRHLPGLKCQ